MESKKSGFAKVYERIMGKPLNRIEESKDNTQYRIAEDIIICIKENATFPEDRKTVLINFMNKFKTVSYGI